MKKILIGGKEIYWEVGQVAVSRVEWRPVTRFYIKSDRKPKKFLGINWDDGYDIIFRYEENCTEKMSEEEFKKYVTDEYNKYTFFNQKEMIL